MMRRCSSDLNVHVPQLNVGQEEIKTLEQLKEWRFQFERNVSSTTTTSKNQKDVNDENKRKTNDLEDLDNLLEEYSNTTEPPNDSPSQSICSNDKGYIYVFDGNNSLVDAALHSPKEEKTRSAASSTFLDLSDGNDCKGKTLCGTPFHAIVLSNDVKKVRRLLNPLLEDTPERSNFNNNGNDRNNKDYNDKLVQMLFTTDKTGSTPLFLCKSAIMADILLSAGADINARNNDGLTPLHKSALFGRIDVVCRLLEGNARVDILDERGRSAYDICKQRFLMKRKKGSSCRLKATMILLENHDVKNIKRKETLNNRNNYGSYRSGGCRCLIS